MHFRVLAWRLYRSCSCWNVSDQHIPQRDDWFSFPRFSRVHKVCENYASLYMINLVLTLLVIVFHRSVSCQYAITNRCLSHTRCILPTTSWAGNRARLSSEPFQSTLRSSLSEYGLYLSLHINIFVLIVCIRDTVDAVGLIPHRLPFTQVNDNIKYFRHAISLDERRV